MRTFSNNIRFEKGIKVLSNKRLRTRNSLMVYTEMQFKIKFSPISANIHFLLDIFKHLKASHSSVSTHRYTFLLSCRQGKKKKRLFFPKLSCKHAGPGLSCISRCAGCTVEPSGHLASTVKSVTEEESRLWKKHC